MVKKYEDIMRAMQAGEWSQVYMLCGEEPYYIDRVYQYLVQNALDEAAREFDQQIVYGRDLQGADIGPVISVARGFAMMGGKKVVVVREAQVVKKWEALNAYLDVPMTDTILVICYNGKPDKRQAVWKKLETHPACVWLQSDKLRDYQVERWISSYMQELSQQYPGISFDPRISSLLADHLGTDLSAIVGALRKLIDGRPEGTQVIDTALVERNIGISKDYNILELQSALIRGDIAQANRITQYFASSKDHMMVRELTILYGFFQNLLMYEYMPDKSDRVVAAQLGINPYFVKDYATAAKRYPAGKAFRIIGYFREVDARLKGINNPSAKDADLWKELIYKIMH